jgi:hypothetical protein
MGFLEAVEVYARGERLAGLALVPVGLCLVGAGLYLVIGYAGGLGKGMGIPLAIAGVAAAIGGGVLVKTVNDRQVQLAEAFEVEPDAPRAAEVTRMDKVNANWSVLKTAWSVTILVGLGLLFAVGRPWVQGLALALICLCALALVVDTFAEVRARLYADRLAALAD